jgi:hypothetical protein
MDPIIDGRPVEGFPAYRVTPDGQVWTCWKGAGNVIGMEMGDEFRPMKHSKARSGKLFYLRVGLYKGNGERRQYMRFVHTLVLEAFVCPRPLGMQCRHLDNNSVNNCLSNLCWGTHTENQHDRRRFGTTIEGEKHGQAKLTEQLVRQIRSEYANGGVYQYELAEKYGVRQAHVARIVTGKSWSHIKEQEAHYEQD